MPSRLRMKGIGLRFGATQALRNVSLDVGNGEVHALIGENGAGKSSLMKVLSGAYLPDEGSIELDGHPFQPRDPLHARKSGISMIYQELTLAQDLTVEENILLGEEPRRLGFVRRRERRRLAASALTELHHSAISLDRPVRELPLAEQQIVEIARALIGSPKVIVMDEPTSSLARADSENLFRVIGRLRHRGVSVIYISHFLEECQHLADRFTVLRDGETVGEGKMAETSVTEIIRLMVGREISEIYPKTPHALGESVVEWNQLAGHTKPKSATLRLRKGEILGIAGLIGAGRTEALRVFFGLDPVQSGEIVIRGRVSSRRMPRKSLADGISLLSEDRKAEGLMLNRSIADNLTLTRFQPLSVFGFISNRSQRRCVTNWMNQLAIRGRSPHQNVGELSGGNQQKVAVGRLLHHNTQVLLLDEPTRGIDVGSKVQIYQWMGRLAAEGRSILFVSSYLPELLGVCDTIGVMCRGVLAEVRPTSAWTEQSIMEAAIGTNQFSG